MAPLDRLRKRGQDEDPATGVEHEEDRTAEEALRARLAEDPNDIAAFDALADIVRRHATEGHEVGNPQVEANDAVWALAEEVARSNRAWYPLIELARLSIDDDRETALRRLATAAERDSSGTALAQGLQTLRDAGHPDDALGLGVGHWRPRDHDPEAGRQLVEAAVEAGRIAEARRHLDALSLHPETARVTKLRQELERRIARAEKGGAPRSGGPGSPMVDVREPGGRIRSFFSR